MICNLCNAQNDHGGGYCGTCGSPLREGGLPHPTYTHAVAQGRAEERAAIVAYMRREAPKFRVEGEALAKTMDSKLRARMSKQIMEAIGGAVEGLAGFFEDGGHLK